MNESSTSVPPPCARNTDESPVSARDRILYSGDRPNPELAWFAASHAGKLEHASDDRQPTITEFSEAIRATRNSLVYRMHGYHLGKKPHDAIARYILHYTSEGDLVLDPFCGSGSTATAALGLNRSAIAIDVSPAATFITRFYVTRTDSNDLKMRFNAMCRAVADDMRMLYDTRCQRCGGPAVIRHVVYSSDFQCPRCRSPVSLYEASQHRPPCCPVCLRADGNIVPISSRLPRLGERPVAVTFACKGGCRPPTVTRSLFGTPDERTAFERLDLPALRDLESCSIPYPIPERFMMHVADPEKAWGDEWRPSRNFRTVAELFTHRNLWALAALFHAAGDDNDLRAILTASMLALSRKAQHLSGGGGYIPGNWALPAMSKQRNVMDTVTRVFHRILKAKMELSTVLRSQSACISTQSATDLSAIPDDTIDYVFTDPPYGDSVQYAELNFPWECWLGFDTSWHDREIVVNATRGKSESDWAALLGRSMEECFRVLKPGAWLSLCFHHASWDMWQAVRDIMIDAGFELGESARAVTIETDLGSYNTRVTDKSVKRDMVMSFRKPHTGAVPTRAGASERNRNDDSLHLNDIISDYLRKHPGSTRDRIFDHAVNILVRNGAVTDTGFEAVLRTVGEERPKGSRAWYTRD